MIIEDSLLGLQLVCLLVKLVLVLGILVLCKLVMLLILLRLLLLSVVLLLSASKIFFVFIKVLHIQHLIHIRYPLMLLLLDRMLWRSHEILILLVINLGLLRVTTPLLLEVIVSTNGLLLGELWLTVSCDIFTLIVGKSRLLLNAKLVLLHTAITFRSSSDLHSIAAWLRRTSKIRLILADLLARVLLIDHFNGFLVLHVVISKIVLHLFFFSQVGIVLSMMIILMISSHSILSKGCIIAATNSILAALLLH